MKLVDDEKPEKKVEPLVSEKSGKADDTDGFLKNIGELVSEYHNGNLRCVAIVYRRKECGGTRTFFTGGDDAELYRAVCRLEHDMLGLYSEDVELSEYEPLGDDEGE